MKRRTVPFNQNIYHEIEDEDQAQEYIDASLPLVGEVVMYFNNLEQALGESICEIISDRSHSPGLIVIEKLSYAAKVDLFKRFCDEFHLTFGKTPETYVGLIEEMLELGRLRNLVVHADWWTTDQEGYTFTKVKVSVNGMSQEYVQFSPESLAQLVDRINATHHRCGAYWENREEMLLEPSRRGQEIRDAG